MSWTSSQGRGVKRKIWDTKEKAPVHFNLDGTSTICFFFYVIFIFCDPASEMEVTEGSFARELLLAFAEAKGYSSLPG